MSDTDDSDGRGEFDPRTATYHCEVCGTPQSHEDYVAVGPGTPAARHLDIEDPSRAHHVVCNDCFEQAAEEIATDGVAPADISCPTLPDGDLDYQAMINQLGLGDVTPQSPVFITDHTESVTRVLSTDAETGVARLRSESSGEEFTVDIADLWTDWRKGDLRYVSQEFHLER